ncbi:MAG: type III-B CRISPR module-associated protein Cmr5 [Gammaproteobacteria bacterium]|nr:type III-B CRISPR module-associated protein Cmr5 [Gammaproteobacteria bacterium]
MKMQGIQQRRAAYALEQVQAAARDSKVNQKEYKSYAYSLPAMIHINGLGQAAAFFKSKGGTHERLYDLLSEWLTRKEQPYHDKNDLLAGITQENMRQYRLAQAEAQALMDWVKKFAKAYMDDKPSGSPDSGEAD